MDNKTGSEFFNIDDLVVKAQGGDSEATAQVIERYKGFVMKQAARFTIPSYDYEDLVQHGFLSIIKCIKLYKPQSKRFDPYVMNAVKNNMGCLLRGNIKHFREVPDDNNENKSGSDYQFTLEDEVIAYEETEKLYSAMESLSEEEREIVIEFYFKGTNLSEYALKNNKKYSALIFKKNRALKKLKKYLGDMT